MRSIFSLVLVGIIATYSIEAPCKKPAATKQTVEEQVAAIKSKYKQQAPLTEFIREGSPNTLDKSTLYYVRNFRVAAKISGGYILVGQTAVWSSGNSMAFKPIFVSTKKSIPEDVLVSGFVGYVGEESLKKANGYEGKQLKFIVPEGLPLTGIREGGDPFKPEEY